MITRLAVALAAVLVLSACTGGGGGNQPTTMSPDRGPETAPEVSRLAFPLTSGSVGVTGIQQSDSPLNQLPSVGARRDSVVRYGTLNDGVGRATVSAYLSEAALFGDAVSRFAAAPVLRVSTTATERERRIIREAVDAVNLSLPPGYRIGAGQQVGVFPTDVVEIKFVSCAEYGRCGQAAASTATRVSRDANERQTERHAVISIARETNAYRDDWQATVLTAHELLHALGIDFHVSERFDSIMHAGNHYAYATPSFLTPLDREALNALYRRLEPGDGPDDFGAWSSSSLHIAGNGPHANFGVAMRNGYAEPWAHGPAPTTALADNRSLSGSATWDGDLLGLTPNAEAVAGDAEISVTLATLTGRADFTDLEVWAANTAPGAAGTGSQWLDGDLGYTIAVEGATFRKTGGDAGRLMGIFTGSRHQGAAGTLERSDLTAAFGARQ